MSVGGWIAIGYGAVALLALRPVAGAIAWHEKSTSDERPTGDDWFISVLGALIACGFWPLVVGVLIVLRVPFRSGYEREADHRAQVRAQAERIRELERQAGIR